MVWVATRGQPGGERLPVPGDGERIVVEVLNTTDTDGLAREITRYLRRAGIDVVSFGSNRDRPVDSTTILIRRGDSTAALRIRAALGLGRIRAEPDARLLLDASVLLGPDASRVIDLHP